MSVIIRLVVGFALALVSILFFNAAGGKLDAEAAMQNKIICGATGIGAAMFLLLAVLEIAKKSGGKAAKPSTADELRKLGDLRKTGTITDQEFELQKSKLL